MVRWNPKDIYDCHCFERFKFLVPSGARRKKMFFFHLSVAKIEVEMKQRKRNIILIS